MRHRVALEAQRRSIQQGKGPITNFCIPAMVYKPTNGDTVKKYILDNPAERTLWCRRKWYGRTYGRLSCLLRQNKQARVLSWLPTASSLWFFELKMSLPASGAGRAGEYGSRRAHPHGDNARKIEGTLEVRGGDPRD